ncbi:uncharacterized protein LOC129944775 [Eupeodes corollae]|uniref:uncharacterized protein LOC129944775 n=1 Tax=Eupeodes corollae TaxID=290404 RepID=UPI00249142F8|nr:uncharacterized protein LOC129944775 [Eupeodes corollae]
MTTSRLQLQSEIFQNHPVNSTLLMAIVWTINNAYIGDSSALVFSLWSSTAEDDSYQKQLLGDIMTSISESKLTSVIEIGENVKCQQNLQDGSMSECLVHRDIILMIDSFESFMRFKKELKKENYLVRGYYTIIFTGNKQRYFNIISRIFKEIFRAFIVNVNIYVEVLNQTLVYTYYPYTRFHCRGSVPMLLNRFMAEDGFIFPKRFFPKKVDNFFGCSLTVASWSGPPFIFFKRRHNEDIKIYGIEGELIKMLSNKMNFKMNFLLTTKRGRVFPNLTAVDGAVKLIIDGQANITINSFVYSEFNLKAMLASYTYASYAIIVAVPQGDSLSSIQRLTRPFKYIIWSCLSSSVIAGIVIIFVIQCLRKRTVQDFVFGPLNSTPFTNLLNVFLGGPLTVLPRRNFARYILLVWLMYTMVLRNAYSGELYIMLQDSSSIRNLQTAEELVEKNFTIWCADNTIEVIRKSTKTKRLKVIQGQPFRYLAQLHDNQAKFGVVILEPLLTIYNRIFHRIPRVETLPTKLLSAPLTMYFQRHSYLLEVIDRQLMAFVASGLMEAWDRFYLFRYKQDSKNREPAVLSVELLMGIFSAYLLFLGFAFLVFLLELWSKQSPICRSVMNFFNI